MSLSYHAVLVNKDGIVEYIRPAGTLKTEQAILKYWTKGKYKDLWNKSFIAKSPLSFREGDKIKL